MLIFYRPKKEIKELNTMENTFEIMRQARVFLAQHRDLIPLHHVEEVLTWGSVEMYVVSGGTNIHTDEGNRTLTFEMALYLLCLELCNLGLGDRPYQPHPYMHDPIIVEPAEVAEAPEEGLVDQPGDPLPDPLDIGQVPPQGGEGVRIVGPFLWPGPSQPPMVLLPNPSPEPEVKPEVKPKTEVKPEPNQGPGEYIEPTDEEYTSF
jgi:hypothetical protein